jgi:hypothetical protein
MVVEQRVDRQVALHKDETRPGCIKKGHAPYQISQYWMIALLSTRISPVGASLKVGFRR